MNKNSFYFIFFPKTKFKTVAIYAFIFHVSGCTCINPQNNRRHSLFPSTFHPCHEAKK